MKYPLVGRDPVQVVNRELIPQMQYAAKIGQNLILIPLLEDHAVKSEGEKQKIISVITQALNGMRDNTLRIAFETELPVNELIDFVDRFKSPRVGVYYDIGNCTSYGFDCPRDFKMLGTRVFGVHVKDRKGGSTQSVILGTGDADFEKCFAVLSEIGYNGTYILQAWRSDDYLGDAKRQLEFVREILKKHES
ncbi:MAG: xylose isomerase domain-containing protein [Parcubacteria group bacterium Gr01-1014_33]|nr:MAG: xylose isomerase domain-containing protein [Parcubacteria group bacterium Gr01-1014_33]